MMATPPVLPKGYLGPQSKFTEFGLSTLSHNNPEIEIDDNELEIKIQTRQPTKVTANLINVQTGQTTKENVFHQSDGDVIRFTVGLPEAGYYKLQLYALPASDQSRSLPGVFNYLIHCLKVPRKIHPYPKQYAPWKDGCCISGPLVIKNCTDLSKVPFKLRVPCAQSVAVTVDGEWQHLEKREEGLWEGNVCLEKYKGSDVKIALNANFGGDKSKYTTLLDYHLMGDVNDTD